MTAQMRVAVVGASGNVGTALLRTLAYVAPSWQIVGVCRRPPPPGEAAYDRVRWVPCDVSGEGADVVLKQLFSDVDVVVHLAWRIQPTRNTDVLRRTNVDGSRRVFAAATDAGTPHLVHFSSVGAYSPGHKDRPVSESWPTGGVATSTYSVHKAEVERILDDIERRPDAPAIARVRPGLIFQHDAATEVARLFLGPLVPQRLIGLRRAPILPVPDCAVFQCVHADDVADAVWRILTQRATGPFNLAAPPVITPKELAAIFRGRRGTLSESFLRDAMKATWRLRLQPTDPGWLDLLAAVPVMSTARAREELGWYARHDARMTIADLLEGMRKGAGTCSPVLAPRRAIRRGTL